jgi:predicted DNA-binding transcriptional regulator AlpA
MQNETQKRKSRWPGLTTSGEIPTGLRNLDALPDSALVSQIVVEGAAGISPATVWRRVKSGLLPQPTRRGRTTRWQVGALRTALKVGSA